RRIRLRYVLRVRRPEGVSLLSHRDRAQYALARRHLARAADADKRPAANPQALSDVAVATARLSAFETFLPGFLQMAAAENQTGELDRIRIFSGPLSMFGAKVEIAAREKGLAFDLIMVPFSMKRRYEPKHPDVLRINPKKQVPVLIEGCLEIF